MQILTEFKDFISKGNVIDLAVGVVIGGAFGKLVEGVVKGLIEPVVASVSGKADTGVILAGLSSLLSGAGSFLMLAAVVFFVFVKPMNKMRALAAAKAPALPPPGPTQEELLAEIRDLLKKNN